MPLLLFAGAACALAAVLWLAYGAGHLGVDAMWSLQWGDDLLGARGLTPTNGTTPHPLANVAAAVADLAGRDADRVLIACSYVGAAGLILAGAVLASRLSGQRAAGIGAAVLIATRPELLASTVTGALDVWAAALMCGAVALAVPAPRGKSRDRPAMLLLLAAGLLRPEAWALALAWWAWRAWTDRELHVGQLALALAAPLLWMGSDALLTGDALFAIHQTDEAAGLLRLVQGIETGPWADVNRAARGIGSAVQLPLLAALTACAAWWLVRWRTGADDRGVPGTPPTAPAPSLLVWAALGLFVVLLLAQAAAGTLIFSRFALVVTALAAALVAATVVEVAAARRWSTALVAGAVVAAVVLPSTGAWTAARSAAGTATDRYEAARGALRPGVPCAPLATTRTGLSIYATRWTGLAFDEVLENQTGPLPGPATYADVARADSLAFLRDPREFPPIGAPGSRVVRTTPGWVVTTTCP